MLQARLRSQQLSKPRGSEFGCNALPKELLEKLRTNIRTTTICDPIVQPFMLWAHHTRYHHKHMQRGGSDVGSKIHSTRLLPLHGDAWRCGRRRSNSKQVRPSSGLPVDFTTHLAATSFRNLYLFECISQCAKVFFQMRNFRAQSRHKHDELFSILFPSATCSAVGLVLG